MCRSSIIGLSGATWGLTAIGGHCRDLEEALATWSLEKRNT
jgi:hypothetical protein